LWHSNFGRSEQASTVKIRRALGPVQERAPWMEVDGEISGDLALNGKRRAQVMPRTALSGNANLLERPKIDAAHISHGLLKAAAGGSIGMGLILLGAAQPVRILTASAKVRRILNMPALLVADSNIARQFAKDEFWLAAKRTLRTLTRHAASAGYTRDRLLLGGPITKPKYCKGSSAAAGRRASPSSSQSCPVFNMPTNGRAT
jgi:hypothetical protein